MSLSTVLTNPTIVGIYVAGTDEPTRDFFGERAAWVSLYGFSKLLLWKSA